MVSQQRDRRRSSYEHKLKFGFEIVNIPSPKKSSLNQGKDGLKNRKTLIQTLAGWSFWGDPGVPCRLQPARSQSQGLNTQQLIKLLIYILQSLMNS